MDRLLKPLSAALLAAVLVLSTGCKATTNSEIINYDYSQMDLIQLREPDEGRDMVVFDTSLGTIKAVLYPEYAPNAVANFVARVNEGFYDEKEIYNIQPDVYFITGAANESFNSGVTTDGNKIENEYSVNLWPFKGSLMLYNADYEHGKGDSRFVMVDSYPFEDKIADTLRSFEDDNGGQIVPEELIQTFYENECVVSFSGYYTIFGQTIDGFEVIERITATPIDEKTFRPLEPLYINKATMTTYSRG